MTTIHYDCAIIGGGPGGLVSALYLGRYKRKTVVINSGTPRAQWAPRIQNLVGYTDGVPGKELLTRLRTQISKVCNDFVQGEAVVHPRRGFFEVVVGHQKIHARKVILATGMEDEQPPVPNFSELRDEGLLAYCPICDGYEHRADPVALLVDGCHCLNKAIHLSSLIPRLHVVGIRDFDKVSKRFKAKMEEHGIHFYHGHLEALEPVSRPRGLRIRLKDQKPLLVRLGYVALGVKVRDSAFAHLTTLNRTNDGFLTVSTHQETTIPGLYAVGDCVNGLSQVSVAIGQAAIAATDVHNSLDFPPPSPDIKSKLHQHSVQL